MDTQQALSLSGERIHAWYALRGSRAEAEAQASDLCVEQTIEFPVALVHGAIRQEIVGRVEAFEGSDAGWVAEVSFAAEVAGTELSQLFNVLFGNISLKPGIRLERFALPPSLLQAFAGPRFGRAGLRSLLSAPRRPLLCTALKPMGLSGRELAELAYQFALGGVDMIKDDHGLSDQAFCRFDDRVARVCEAVRLANDQTGGCCLYLPHVTAAPEEMRRRADLAASEGAGGALVAPGICGFDAMHALADDSGFGLPIMSHPALQGSFVVSPEHGISHHALFGLMHRLAGADATIFPSSGGRFAFGEDDCRALVDGTGCPMGGLRRSFPVPAGGMRLERVPALRAFYGDDMVLLIGGDLHQGDGDLVERCRRFRALVA